jgi:hypothetical protein
MIPSYSFLITKKSANGIASFTLSQWASIRSQIDPNNQMIWSAEGVDTSSLPLPVVVPERKVLLHLEEYSYSDAFFVIIKNK